MSFGCTNFSKSVVFCCVLLAIGTSAAAAKRSSKVAKAAKPAVTATTTATSVYDQLDSDFQQFSSPFYTELANSPKLISYKSMDRLDAAIQMSLQDNDPMAAVATLIHHYKLISRNIDNPKIINFISLLLDNNELVTAEKLRAQIQEDGSKALQANISYLFANFYFQRNNWTKTIASLDGITGDLPQQRFHHALLIQGISLQKLKKHRLALAVYEKIPATSPYYDSARLNMAVADIRQDWWTDAHIVINQLLSLPRVRQQYDEADRLNTVMGYSFLQQAYYRDARNAFRNVGLKGSYTNQALLGIALSAANQEDYIGALNAVRILKEYKSLDLPVDESYLLMPYFYERLQQHSTATAGYNEAIQYYENRINSLSALQKIDDKTFTHNVGFLTDGTLSLQLNIIDLDNIAPPAFINNYHLVQKMQPYMTNGNMTAYQPQFYKLQAAHQSALHEAVNLVLQQRIVYLTDYMNQSRYGIARLLDKNENLLK